MALEYKDRVKDQTITTGTGSFTLALSAPSGFRTFATFTDGATVRYSVASTTAAEWEVGQGVWNNATSTLSRDTIFASSNAGAQVNFSVGTKTVTAGPVAQDLLDAATLTGAQTLTNKTLTNPAGTYQTLTDGATVSWDCNAGQLAYLTLGGNRTLAAPTNMKAGGSYFLFLTQDSTGSRRVFWNSTYKWPGGVPPTLTVTPGQVDIMHMVSDGASMYCQVFVQNVGSSSTTPPPPPPDAVGLGHNLSGMEWVPNVKRTPSTRVNMNWVPPRLSDLDTMASWGYPKLVNRLPVSWEMLQPVLLGAPANATVLAAEGVSAAGDLHPGYLAYIRQVLDKHAAIGAKCIIDLHNYCRYRDYVYQGDGSVTNYTAAVDAYTRPYADNANTVVRICALATGGTAFNGTTISQTQFNDLWTKIATQFNGHAGLAGYGLMNEPHDMPASGGVVENTSGGESYTIWNTFATGAVTAIRAVDSNTPIYVSGNSWSSAISWATSNPGYPIAGATNIVYEAHAYLDSTSSGMRFDYDNEASYGFSAGEAGATGISQNTFYNRLVPFVTWCNTYQVRGSVNEMGMPTNEGNLPNDRWATMFKTGLDFLYANGIEVMSWMHSSLWTIQNYATNATIGWHELKPVEPAVSGLFKAMAGVDNCSFFATADKAWGTAGTALTIRIWGRGNITTPRTFTVSTDNGGTLSADTVTVAAGYNPRAAFTYVTASERKATISFAGAGAPMPIFIYSQSNPAGITNIYDRAMAICAKYDAAKWEMQHGYTDYTPSAGIVTGTGEELRAVRDSGYASKVNNIYDMRSFWNNDLPGVAKHPFNPGWTVPKAALVNGRVAYSGVAEEATGLWCKKRAPQASATKSLNIDPNPLDKALFHLNDDFFIVVCFRPRAAASPTNDALFSASRSDANTGPYVSIGFDGSNQMRLRWRDSADVVNSITGTTLTGDTNHTASCRFTAGSQIFRVNGAQVGSAAVTPAASSYFDTMLVGQNFWSFFLRDGGFNGYIYAAIAGKGAPTAAELAALESYLTSLGV